MSTIQRAALVAATVFAVTVLPANALSAHPSRPASKDCTWKAFSDAKLGLEAWVSSCTYGKRKIEYMAKDGSLVEHWSDNNNNEPVIDMLDLKPGESPEAGIKRVWLSHTDAKTAAQCVIAPFVPDEGSSKTPPGVKRYTFVPNAAYQKALDAKHEEGVPDPACGEWGSMPDGIQYFEAQPATGSRKVMFVRGGQDIPLYDEATLHLLPAP
jgi:hypothetical protein